MINKSFPSNLSDELQKLSIGTDYSWISALIKSGMMPENNESKSTDYYFINTNEIHHKSSPSPLDNLISLYGLENIGKSVARLNPDGSKGVKLRKSYKTHILDLDEIGKRVIPNERTISPIVFGPIENRPLPSQVKSSDSQLLSQAFSFLPKCPIPGFNEHELCIKDDKDSKRRDELSDTENGLKKKRKKKLLNGTGSGGDFKRVHT